MSYFTMKHVPLATSVSIADWLRRHGHPVRHSLTKQERAQLVECFTLMDRDGSGAIDFDELCCAFRFLGLHFSKQAVADLLAQVDSDGSGVHRFVRYCARIEWPPTAEADLQVWLSCQSSSRSWPRREMLSRRLFSGVTDLKGSRLKGRMLCPCSKSRRPTNASVLLKLSWIQSCGRCTPDHLPDPSVGKPHACLCKQASLSAQLVCSQVHQPWRSCCKTPLHKAMQGYGMAGHVLMQTHDS